MDTKSVGIENNTHAVANSYFRKSSAVDPNMNTIIQREQMLQAGSMPDEDEMVLAQFKQLILQAVKNRAESLKAIKEYIHSYSIIECDVDKSEALVIVSVLKDIFFYMPVFVRGADLSEFECLITPDNEYIIPVDESWMNIITQRIGTGDIGNVSVPVDSSQIRDGLDRAQDVQFGGPMGNEVLQAGAINVKRSAAKESIKEVVHAFPNLLKKGSNTRALIDQIKEDVRNRKSSAVNTEPKSLEDSGFFIVDFFTPADEFIKRSYSKSDIKEIRNELEGGVPKVFGKEDTAIRVRCMEEELNSIGECTYSGPGVYIVYTLDQNPDKRFKKCFVVDMLDSYPEEVLAESPFNKGRFLVVDEDGTTGIVPELLFRKKVYAPFNGNDPEEMVLSKVVEPDFFKHNIIKDPDGLHINSTYLVFKGRPDEFTFALCRVKDKSIMQPGVDERLVVVDEIDGSAVDLLSVPDGFVAYKINISLDSPFFSAVTIESKDEFVEELTKTSAFSDLPIVKVSWSKETNKVTYKDLKKGSSDTNVPADYFWKNMYRAHQCDIKKMSDTMHKGSGTYTFIIGEPTPLVKKSAEQVTVNDIDVIDLRVTFDKLKKKSNDFVGMMDNSMYAGMAGAPGNVGAMPHGIQEQFVDAALLPWLSAMTMQESDEIDPDMERLFISVNDELPHLITTIGRLNLKINLKSQYFMDMLGIDDYKKLIAEGKNLFDKLGDYGLTLMELVAVMQ